MKPEDQQRAFDVIERSLWFRPRTRARRLTESIKEYAEDSVAAKDRWFGAVISLPLLLPAVTAARSIEGVQRFRIKARYQQSFQLFEERLALIEEVRDRISRPDSPYRDSALTKAIATLPFELSALFIEGTEASTVRYTIHSPVEDWPDDRGVEGVCQLVMTDTDVLPSFNLWREQGSHEVNLVAERIRETSERCLTCKVSYERWTWNHGSLGSLAARHW